MLQAGKMEKEILGQRAEKLYQGHLQIRTERGEGV